MNYNKSGLKFQSGTISIYNTQKCEYSEISSPDDLQLGIPFNLSISSLLPSTKNSFTSFAKGKGEIVEYKTITTLSDFYGVVTNHDHSGAELVDGNRSSTNIIKSDVLCLDIDNDENNQEFFDDFSNHLSIEKFSEMFKDYEFLIVTSRNHMKEKDGKKARERYHAFMSLGRIIDEQPRETIIAKIKQISFHISEQRGGSEVSLIDNAPKPETGFYGSNDSKVFYNKGGSIDGLLNQGTFQSRYERHTGHNRRPDSRRHTKSPTGAGDFANNAKTDWVTENILRHPKRGLEYFYGKLNNHGGYYYALCDLHNDKKPSLEVYESGWCKCKAGCTDDKSIHYLAYERRVLEKEGRKFSRVELIRKHTDELNLDFNEYLMDASCWKGDWDAVCEGLEKYVPVDNLDDVFISFDDYKKLKELNKDYAISRLEGKVVVLRHQMTRLDDVKDEKDLIYQSRDDFKNEFENVNVRVKEKNGLEKVETKKENGEVDIKWEIKWKVDTRTLGQLWLGWHKRREYEIATFHPSDERKIFGEKRPVWDYFDDWSSATWENGWIGSDEKRGLKRFIDLEKFRSFTSVEEAKKSCALYLKHISNVLCGNYTGNRRELLNDYILNWMASCVSRHMKDRVTVALVLQSGQGTGKGMFSQFFGQLFGKFWLHLTDSKQLTTQFNKLMSDKLLVFADEITWGGDKKNEGLLKTMTTEDTMIVEHKFRDAFSTNNYRRFIFSSNNEWVVPKEIDGRRFQVIDLPSRKLGDGKYLKHKEEWLNGGREGFYYYLLSPEMQERVSGFHFEKEMIETKGGLEQQKETEPHLGWWHQILVEGGHKVKEDANNWRTVYWKEDTQNILTEQTDNLYISYQEHMKQLGKRAVGDKGKLTGLLKKLGTQGVLRFHHLGRSDKTIQGERVTSVKWCFESLKDARKTWDKKWNNGEDSFGLEPAHPPTLPL